MVAPGKPRGLPSGPRASIMVAVPTYSGELHHRFVESYVAAVVYSLTKRIELELRIVAGASLIQYARNQLIREFLEEPGYTHMMWIDADVGFDPRAIVKLVEHEKDVIGGVYPMKTMPLQWPYEAKIGEQTAEVHRANVLPGGFMLCSKKAIQTVADASPGYWHYTGGLRYRTKHVMDLVLENDTLLGEDVILCRRFQQAGFDVWVEPDIAFSHTGRFEWRGILRKAIEQGATQGSVHPSLTQDLTHSIEPHEINTVVTKMYEQWGNTWAAPAPLLMTLAILARKATTILETGSGLSTLVMAAANPDAHVHVLEHDPEWSKKLLDECRTHGLTNVTVHLTTLTDTAWFYQIPDDLPKSFDLVFHDGPVFLEGTKLAKSTDTRLAFYEVLADRIQNATLVIDDIEHYMEYAQRYRHEIIGNRFAVCLPNTRKAEAA